MAIYFSLSQLMFVKLIILLNQKCPEKWLWIIETLITQTFRFTISCSSRVKNVRYRGCDVMYSCPTAFPQAWVNVYVFANYAIYANRNMAASEVELRNKRYEEEFVWFNKICFGNLWVIRRSNEITIKCRLNDINLCEHKFTHVWEKPSDRKFEIIAHSRLTMEAWTTRQAKMVEVQRFPPLGRSFSKTKRDI